MPELASYESSLGPLSVGLRKDLHVTRQRTRSGPRYVLHDPVAFRNHAFSIEDYRILMAIVPSRTLEQVFTTLVEDGFLDEDDKQRFFEFVLWLHDTGLVQLPLGRSDALFERYLRKAKGRRSAILQGFLNLKLPLFDPDLFLQRTLRYVGWLFGRPGLALWCCLMGLVAWKCTGRIGELFGETAGLLSLHNLPILWVALIGLKGLHEFGHAYACRHFGGAVPEMGVVLIVLTPCAYVDATASWKFDRRQRIAVALAGMYVESIVAGVFAVVWAGTQPGLLHDVSTNIVILASITTVLLNLNPLMKFDGYYVFSDLVGVFNLQERAFRSLKGWAGWLLLGQHRPRSDGSAGEQWLYATYGPAAFVYRVSLAFAITGLVMMRWPALGLILGALFVWVLMVQPVLRAFVYLWSSAETERARTRARLVAAGSLIAVPVLLGLLPVSWNVVVPGVLVPRVRNSVRAPASGFVVEVAPDRGQVTAGSLLCVLRDPELEARRLEVSGQVHAKEVSLDTVELDDPKLSSHYKTELATLRARLENIDERLSSMRLTAPIGGSLVRADRARGTGRYVNRGEELFQIQAGHNLVRIVLTDYEVSRARLEIGSPAEIRWACDPTRSVHGVVREIRRSASRSHVPLSLTLLGGGEVYAEPTGAGTATAQQSYLHVFLETDEPPLRHAGTGMTARVRVRGRVEVLGTWIKRRVLSFLDAWRMT